MSSRVWISALYVHAQRTMCTTQLSKSTSSLVYLLCIGELHVVVRVDPVVVCDDAVVRRTLVLIALHRGHCFRRSHFSKNFAVWEIYCLHTPSVTVNCCWLLPNFEL